MFWWVSEMGCIPRLENHYPSPRMGAMRALAVYIAMTFLHRVVMLSRSRKFVRYPEARWANSPFGTIQVLHRFAGAVVNGASIAGLRDES